MPFCRTWLSDVLHVMSCHATAWHGMRERQPAAAGTLYSPYRPNRSALEKQRKPASRSQPSGRPALRLILDSRHGYDLENPSSPVRNLHQFKASITWVRLFWAAVISAKRKEIHDERAPELEPYEMRPGVVILACLSCLIGAQFPRDDCCRGPATIRNAPDTCGSGVGSPILTRGADDGTRTYKPGSTSSRSN